jgi:cold shock CspA family protein/uncharacterized LabA/DUF88 family protein
MAKIMIFIDGSWLYNNSYSLSRQYGERYNLDYGKLPNVLGEVIGKNLGQSDVDIVRTYLFGSLPRNYDILDDELVTRQKNFYDLLKEEYHYEVEIFPIDYRGHRIKKSDRNPNDDFQPQEKCVDIALATSMLYLAAIPYSYDIAVAVIGDRDFMPMLQHVRRLGKRVAIASIKDSCTYVYSDPKDEYRLKDFDIIWIEDYLEILELKLQRRKLECQSPHHVGDRSVYTTDFLRKGLKFYCDDCKTKFQKQRKKQEDKIRASYQAQALDGEESEISDEIRCEGTIKYKNVEGGYGFITGVKGDYYFHLSVLLGDIEFSDLKIGDRVVFDPDIPPDPNAEKPAGKASNVQLKTDKNEK